MKFGKRFVERQSSHGVYVDYKSLKKSLKSNEIDWKDYLWKEIKRVSCAVEASELHLQPHDLLVHDLVALENSPQTLCTQMCDQFSRIGIYTCNSSQIQVTRQLSLESTSQHRPTLRPCTHLVLQLPQ